MKYDEFMATHCWKPWSTQPWTKPRRVPCPPASTQAATCRADIAICMDCHPHLLIIRCELLLERHLLALSPPASPRPQNQFAKIDVHQLFSLGPLGPLGQGTQLDSGSKEQARAQWHWDLRYNEILRRKLMCSRVIPICGPSQQLPALAVPIQQCHLPKHPPDLCSTAWLPRDRPEIILNNCSQSVSGSAQICKDGTRAQVKQIKHIKHMNQKQYKAIVCNCMQLSCFVALHRHHSLPFRFDQFFVLPLAFPVSKSLSWNI